MICPHNDHVICDGAQSCKRCGWDPEEHARRVAKLSTMGTVETVVREIVEEVKSYGKS